LRAADATQAAMALLPGAGTPRKRWSTPSPERREPPSTGASPLRSHSHRTSAPEEAVGVDYVADAAAGDVRAFEYLYRTHLPRVHSLVRRMAGGRDTDELTQDVFVRVWQKLGTFRGDSAFGTWLHRLAVNVVIERFRTDAARRQRLHDGEEIFNQLPAPVRSGDLSMDFDAALMTLPDGAREIFVLHDVEGHKHHEIAAMLEISPGTSKAQLHRARMMLRRFLTQSHAR
jgi:RNA polymerase sigma-70 factor (ECF subfamily)